MINREEIKTESDRRHMLCVNLRNMLDDGMDYYDIQDCIGIDVAYVEMIDLYRKIGAKFIHF